MLSVWEGSKHKKDLSLNFIDFTLNEYASIDEYVQQYHLVSINLNEVSLVMETQLSSSATAEDSLSRLRDCIEGDVLLGEWRLRRKGCRSSRCSR